MKKIYVWLFMTLVVSVKAQVSVSSTTNATCSGGCDGSAVVQITGGTNPYTIVFSGSSNVITYTTTANTYTATNLCAAGSSYNVVVADALGNTIGTTQASITSPTPINVVITHTNTSCGLCNGGININATGGVPAYMYSISSNPSPAVSNDICGYLYDYSNR